MKLLMPLIVIVVLLGSQLLPVVPLGGFYNPTVPEASAQAPSGMPGWPLPAKPIPHHEPGHLSRAKSYTTQAVRENDLGVLETVEISGEDALVADGIDPLGANYTLVDLDQIMMNWSADNQSSLQTFSSTLEILPGSQWSLGDYPSVDIAAGDLNGDGQDEQIVAWMDPASGQIRMAIGEMPGSARTTSAPAAVAHTDGSIDLLVRGYDDALWHRHYDGSTWGDWNNSALGTLLSAPAIASQGDGQFDVFAIGTDNQIYRRHWDGGWDAGWQLYAGWPEPPPSWTGPAPELPGLAAVARGGGIDLFRLGPDNTLRWHNGTGWQPLGGMLASAPGAVSWGPGHMQVFARGADDALWYRTFNAGTWEPWQYLGTAGMPEGVGVASAPTPVSPGLGQIRVYVQGSDGLPYWIDYASGNWGSWIQGGGQMASALGAAWAGSQYALFAQQDDGGLQHSADGLVWTPMGGLNPCPVFDTGLVGSPLIYPGINDYSVDVETGYFLGDGRAQIVLAYAKEGWEPWIALFETEGGFTPVLVREVHVPHIAWLLSIATGDFLDVDGIDDVALAYVKGNEFGLDIARLTGSTPGFVPGLHQQETESASCHYSGMQPAGTLEVTSADLDHDGKDEIATTTVFFCEDIQNWLSCQTYGYRFHHRVFDILEPSHSGEPYVLKDFYIDASRGWPNPWLEGQRYADRRSVGLALAAGDLQGDGKDELIRTWPVGFDGDACEDVGFQDRFVRKLQVYQLPTNPDPDTNNWDDNGDGRIDSLVETTLYYDENDYTNRSYGDRLATGDLDRDLREEAVWHKEGWGSRILRTYDYDADQASYVSTDGPPISPAQATYLNLVTGAFSGDSIRVGSPTYRVQSHMVSPEVLLNLPPMHRDIVSEAGEIQIYNGAQATHTAANTVTESSTAESKRDWTLSAELEASAGAGGHKVTASLTNTYGENFRESTTAISTTKFEDTTTAAFYDQVIYNATDYGIWEYPVYGVPEDGGEGQAITVVFPLVSATNQPVTEQGRLCDESFYAPSHQTHNVWSYDPFGTAEDFGDYGSLIDSKQTAGGTDFSVSMSAVSEGNRSSSFHNQISAGLEYKYENELQVPLVGKAWDVSFRAKAEGSYGWEGTSTLGTSFTEDSNVGVDFPGTPDPSNYAIRAYLYWAKAGYLVVDYQTQPSTGGSWGLYTKPDPAFILPWYGFPDPATGVFPSPPDPDAPPCGLDKQLFTHDIDLDPGYVQNGDTVTMTATVRNFSNVNPPSNVAVRFYLGEPGASNQIGTCTIPKANLDRDLGPQQCSSTWVVSGGSGREKIYAAIDPLNAFDEMHDGDDMIDNNIGYGLLYVASADYFDPGLRQAQAYQAIVHQDTPGLGFGLYLPTTNISDTVRYELVPTSLGALRIVGDPIQALAFPGGEAEPDEGHVFAPTPAAMVAFYREGDLLPGMVEGNLSLYRQDGTDWVEAACPGYEVIRFPADNRIAVPICQTGVFVLSDRTPGLESYLYLPLVMRSAP